MNEPIQPDYLMTTEEVRQYLRVKTLRTIYRWVKTGYIPVEGAMGRHLFRKSVIDAWVANGGGPKRKVKGDGNG